MSHKFLQVKNLKWLHFSDVQEADFKLLAKEYKFHALDFNSIRNESELSKIDTYKNYIFIILTVPFFDYQLNKITKRNLALFVGKDYVVTVANFKFEALDGFFNKIRRGKNLKTETMMNSSGFLLYKIVDFIFRDAKEVLKELVRETNELESVVYDYNSEESTKRLGILRSNILFFTHLINSQKIIFSQINNARRSFIPASTRIYFDDVKDTLDSMGVVSVNLKNMVDSMFSVNEAFLSHRTNRIVRLLTIISVILMPPTLLTGYFGMNIRSLPFTNDILSVTSIVFFSMILSIILIGLLDKRR